MRTRDTEEIALIANGITGESRRRTTARPSFAAQCLVIAAGVPSRV
jgi:hypothetical protein